LLSVKDTKQLVVNNKPDGMIRPNMVCKLINLETLIIGNIRDPADLEIYANKNVSRIEMWGSKLPNFENFPSCRKLSINICSCRELTALTLVSTLSTQKHNIQTLSVSADGIGGIIGDVKNLENYCKINGIAWERH